MRAAAFIACLLALAICLPACGSAPVPTPAGDVNGDGFTGELAPEDTGLPDGTDALGSDTPDAIDSTDEPDTPDVPDSADVKCPNGYVFIDFPCKDEFTCVGNFHFRKDKSLTCQDNGYDPACCSGATCQMGAVQACPPNSLCLASSSSSGKCQPFDCGGPGGSPCPIGQTCRTPQGSCDPAITKGVCVPDSTAAQLPACVTCTSDCTVEGFSCKAGQMVTCQEVGGCLKASANTCPSGKTCAPGGQCLPTTGYAGMPCGPGGTCSGQQTCQGASATSPGLCAPACGTCSGATCQPIINACTGFGPTGEAACVGPFPGQGVPVCAMACPVVGECPLGLSCQTVTSAFFGQPKAVCLPARW
jgi:hypothetical protein